MAWVLSYWKLPFQLPVDFHQIRDCHVNVLVVLRCPFNSLSDLRGLISLSFSLCPCLCWQRGRWAAQSTRIPIFCFSSWTQKGEKKTGTKNIPYCNTCVLSFSVTVPWYHQLPQHCFMLTEFLLFLPSVVQPTGYISMDIKNKQTNKQTHFCRYFWFLNCTIHSLIKQMKSWIVWSNSKINKKKCCDSFFDLVVIWLVVHVFFSSSGCWIADSTDCSL